MRALLSGSTRAGSLAGALAGAIGALGFFGLKIFGGTLSGSTTDGRPGIGGTPGMGGGTVFKAGGTVTWGSVGSGIGSGFAVGMIGSGMTMLAAAAAGATVTIATTGADQAVARRIDRRDTPCAPVDVWSPSSVIGLKYYAIFAVSHNDLMNFTL
ncbi:MAG: hypothetical protein ACJ71Z_09770 [Aeromicrobium sp.]